MNATLPHEIRRGGEVRHFAYPHSDLPGCAVIKVARHLLLRHSHPSFKAFKEGKLPNSNSFAPV
jgi:hypothetical protein